MSRTGKPGHLRQQVLSKPELLREYTVQFEQEVRDALPEDIGRKVKRVFGFGCGDSHNAAVSTRMAFAKWASVSMEVLTALEFSRYTTPWLQRLDAQDSLAIGISVSGEVARTVEGVALAKEAGANTMGITCDPQSRIASLADMVLDVSTPPMDIPRVRTYLATQLAMYMVALRLAQAREALNRRDIQELRDQFQKAADIGQATHEAINSTVRELAEQLKSRRAYIFVGGGPNLGSAMFAAAKLLEAEGSLGQPQDLEEWVHLQRFLKWTELPVFLIAPPGLGYSRAVEVARVMKRVHAFLVAVVENGEREISKLADVVLPVQGHLPEELTPLVYSDALEIFASDLADATNEPYFRGFAGPWSTPDGDPIWYSEILESREALLS